jgi:DNA-binding CsgD family transcriptional regulator
VIYVRLGLSVTAMLAGAASVGIAMVVYGQYRKKVALYFAGFLFSLLLFLLAMTTQLFASVARPAGAGAFYYLSLVLMAAGGILYMVDAPHFYHALLGQSVGPVRRTAYLILVVLFSAGTVLVFARPYWALPAIVLNALLFGMIGYGIVLIGIFYRRIGNYRLRRAVGIFFVISVVFFPLMYIDSLSNVISWTPALAGLDGLSLPLFFLVINGLSIVLAAGLFNTPPYVEEGRVTDYFRGVFGISAREHEIIELVVRGHSNKEIGEQLFISAKTVENHLYSIYQKTNVKSRLQLYNLIQENRAG